MYSHVKAIEVSLWGRHVGTIVPKTTTHYRFKYDDDLLEMGARYSIGTAESILAEIKNIFANR